MNNYFKHYGTKYHSGRYPWGSGGHSEQRGPKFATYVKELRADGYTDSSIAKAMGMTTTEFRHRVTVNKQQQRNENIRAAIKYKEKGYSNIAIADKMKTNESNIRLWLKQYESDRFEEFEGTKDILKKQVEKNPYLDVGPGTNIFMGIKETKLKSALYSLQQEGYVVNNIKVEQLGTGQKTTMAVLSKEGVTAKEVFDNKSSINWIGASTTDGGKTYTSIKPPKSISSKKLEIVYAEDGGAKKDGVIELRKGDPTYSLGKASYAQVRIAVDDTHYLKGMAVYSDDLPKGVDVRFNTNKTKDVSKMDVLKKMEPGENPFKTVIRQRNIDGTKELSPINIVREEGEWDTWSKTLSAQMLSKQSNSLIKEQLELTYQSRKNEYDDIMKITNPTIKKKMLQDFADNCDSSAVDLKSQSLPGQVYKVILPLDIKKNEIYAPTYPNGTKLVLVRFPHGGTFEIPELTVNNKNPKGKSILGNALDAVGIHSDVAEVLSGADFDGDTVLTIPNNKGKILRTDPLVGLQNFNPRETYKYYEGMTTMKKSQSGIEMGKITNLIADMQIKGATSDEVAAAVRHSMVVIDAEKHKLDYKQSYYDNNISSLKTKYQGSPTAGASTIISRAKSTTYVPQRDVSRGKYKIDPNTGEKIFSYTGKTQIYKDADGNWKERTDSNGKPILKTETSTKMYETSDANTLSSGFKKESYYVQYANNMKALGDKARKDTLSIKDTTYSPTAAKVYKREVDSLNAKLNIALLNKPLERQAQLVGNKMVQAIVDDTPELANKPSELKKLKGQTIARARTLVGANKQSIVVTPREYEAIQAGAITKSKLDSIIRESDSDAFKKLTMPKETVTLNSSKKSLAKNLSNAGYTQAEIAERIGVPVSVINDAIKEVS